MLRKVEVALVVVELVRVVLPNVASPVTVREDKDPTLVKEEPVMPEPKVVLSKTRRLLMRKNPPVAKFTFPVLWVIPP